MKMAHDNKRMKSLLYRLSWNNNGRLLNDNIAEMLLLGQKCIDVWVSSENNDVDWRKILRYFENIDHVSLDMQECIINVLKPSSPARKRLEERIEFKNRLSECKCQAKILKLQERLANESEKCEMFSKEIEILSRDKRELNRNAANLEQVYRNKEEVLKRQNGKLTENLKQQLSDRDEELEDLRFRFRTQLSELKEGLTAVNRDSYKLRQRLLQIPLLEQNFDHQRQKFISEIRRCRSKIEELEKNLDRQQLELKRVYEENQSLRQQVVHLPFLKSENFKIRENEYQKNINTLEESVAYFVQQHGRHLQEIRELKSQLDKNNTEDNELGKKLKIREEDLERSGRFVKTGQDIEQSLSSVCHEQIEKKGSDLIRENKVVFLPVKQNQEFSESLFEVNDKTLGDKEEAD